MLQSVQHSSFVQHHSSSMRVLLPGKVPCSCRTAAIVSGINQRSRIYSNQQRDVGCSDLYNMTEAINAQSQLDQTPQGTALPTRSNAADQCHTPSEASQPVSTVEDAPTATSNAQRGVGYYAGMVTTDLKVDNNASGSDMLKRSLQLAGGVAGVLMLLTYLFLASNNLV